LRPFWPGSEDHEVVGEDAQDELARHVGGGPGLVDEDQPLGMEIELTVEPFLALLQDVRAVLLGGVPF
jgi:hypothetical protein